MYKIPLFDLNYGVEEETAVLDLHLLSIKGNNEKYCYSGLRKMN